MWLVVSATTAVLGFTGCAGDRYKRSTGEYIDDKSIRLRVSEDLGENPDYKFKGVKVNVFKGTVQLSGFVDMYAQKSRAEEVARQVQGVKIVENRITVKNRGERTAGEYIDEKTLASNVRSSLKNDPNYKFDEVVVTTSKNTVQLSGFVNTADQKRTAGSLAKETPGVKDVVNNINVKDKM